MKLFDIPSRLLKTRKVKELEEIANKENYLRFPTIMIGLLTGFGAFLDSAIGLYIDIKYFSSQHSGLSFILGFVISLPIFFFLPEFLAFLLKRVSRLLGWTETTFQKGQIGVLGFAFLLIGLVLQFLGTLLQFLNNL